MADTLEKILRVLEKSSNFDCPFGATISTWGNKKIKRLIMGTDMFTFKFIIFEVQGGKDIYNFEKTLQYLKTSFRKESLPDFAGEFYGGFYILREAHWARRHQESGAFFQSEFTPVQVFLLDEEYIVFPDKIWEKIRELVIFERDEILLSYRKNEDWLNRW